MRKSGNVVMERTVAGDEGWVNNGRIEQHISARALNFHNRKSTLGASGGSEIYRETVKHLGISLTD